MLELFDTQKYFELTRQPMPAGSYDAVLDRLERERLIKRNDDGHWAITNLGAILFARSLEALGLRRKAVRVVVYTGSDRVQTERELEGDRGYAVGFEGLVGFINDRLPQNEAVVQALRTEVRMFPEVAIRELVANALVHQDLMASGTGPMIEIFDDRMEITNPGAPLIETSRFIDLPPRSRNDMMASFMRRVSICEERGSGIDKVIKAAEVFQLPPPEFQVLEQHTRAILFAPRPFSEMTRDERLRACYQHAALLHVSHKSMTNETLRARFGIAQKNYAMASRVIADTIEAGLIRKADPSSSSRRHASYVPFWA